MDAATAAVETAERYYDSSDANVFYSTIWGGEDIHIGIYATPDESISTASRRTVSEMAARITDLSRSTEVVDLGAGYGGAARYLAQTHGCRVTCVNLSDEQNARNRALTAEAGLSERVGILHANFERLPLADGSCDVVWSQDALLHSAARDRVLSEARRVLRPGGHLIFTDPMQSDHCPDGVLAPVLARLQLANLASFAYYRRTLQGLGFSEVETKDLTEHLVRHYSRVLEELESRSDALRERLSSPYVHRMREGLNHWIRAGRDGHLAWGILHFRI